jgi:hypothetical protein
MVFEESLARLSACRRSLMDELKSLDSPTVWHGPLAPKPWTKFKEYQ